jgi:hypothetical protein
LAVGSASFGNSFNKHISLWTHTIHIQSHKEDWLSTWQIRNCHVLPYATIACEAGPLVLQCYDNRRFNSIQFNSIQRTVSLFICFIIQLLQHVLMHSHALFAPYNRPHFPTASNILLSNPNPSVQLQAYVRGGRRTPNFQWHFHRTILRTNVKSATGTAKAKLSLYLLICSWT